MTGDGHSALAEWMAAVDDEQHLLAGVVKRYDALLGRATTDDDDDGDEDSDDALNDDARDDDD